MWKGSTTWTRLETPNLGATLFPRHCEPTGRANARPMQAPRSNPSCRELADMDCFVPCPPRNDESSRLAGGELAEGCLCRGQPRDRHAIRRARDVIEPD